MQVAFGHIPRLIISTPPRHGKSEFASKYFPVWYLLRFPDERVMLSSYSFDYASWWGEQARDVFNDIGPTLAGLRTNPRSSAAHWWHIDKHAGYMTAVGAGGSLTGKGAHLLLIDDPVKNDKEADSQTYREALWNWFDASAYTRLEPEPFGKCVVTMTRWNEDDLSGRLIERSKSSGPDAEKWVVLNLPALAEDTEHIEYGPSGSGLVWHREPGEALWPERFSRKTLEKRRATMIPRWWNALYQGRPAPQGGAIFKQEHFKYYRTVAGADGAHALYKLGDKLVDAADTWRFAMVDLAASTKTTADYTVVSTWAVTPDNDLLLLDVVRGRFEGPDQPGLIENAFRKWQPAFIGVERAGYQLTLIQTLARAGLPVRELIPDRDKVSRSLTIAARYQLGTVWHPESAAWLPDYENELLVFPNGAHDDMVDTASYAGLALATPEPSITFFDIGPDGLDD